MFVQNICPEIRENHGSKVFHVRKKVAPLQVARLFSSHYRRTVHSSKVKSGWRVLAASNLVEVPPKLTRKSISQRDTICTCTESIIDHRTITAKAIALSIFWSALGRVAASHDCPINYLSPLNSNVVGSQSSQTFNS